MLAKCERYHEFGVAYCWVIDPVNKRAWEYHSGSTQREQTASLSAGELSISLDELFSED
jgi:Uma2 family endonuclease